MSVPSFFPHSPPLLLLVSMWKSKHLETEALLLSTRMLSKRNPLFFYWVVGWTGVGTMSKYSTRLALYSVSRLAIVYPYLANIVIIRYHGLVFPWGCCSLIMRIVGIVGGLILRCQFPRPLSVIKICQLIYQSEHFQEGLTSDNYFFRTSNGFVNT